MLYNLIMNTILPFLVYMLNLRNAGGLEHSDDTARWSIKIAKAAGLTGWEFLRDLEFGTRVHDIGKMGINDAILNKPGRLTENELLAIRQHPMIGVEILGLLDGMNSEVNEDIIAMVREHHENFDGTGYPGKLAGEKINLGARIIRITDSYCAMTTQYRIYRRLINPGDALTIMADHHQHYDPDLLKIFFEAVQ